MPLSCLRLPRLFEWLSRARHQHRIYNRSERCRLPPPLQTNFLQHHGHHDHHNHPPPTKKDYPSKPVAMSGKIPSAYATDDNGERYNVKMAGSQTQCAA
eukprot:9980344-Lingulodinium_polyedra.AAC.1